MHPGLYSVHTFHSYPDNNTRKKKLRYVIVLEHTLLKLGCLCKSVVLPAGIDNKLQGKYLKTKLFAFVNVNKVNDNGFCLLENCRRKTESMLIIIVKT